LEEHMSTHRLTTQIAIFATSALALAACGGDSTTTTAEQAAQVVSSLAERAQEGELTEEDQEDLKDSVGDLLEGMGSTGTGTVTVDGATWSVDVSVCIVDDESFIAQGVASGPGGQVAWFELNQSVTTRAEAATYMDPATLNLLFPDGADTFEEALVELQIGISDRFEQESASPRWTMESAPQGMGGLPIPLFGQLDFRIDGLTFQGSGEAENIADDDGYGDTSQMSVEVTCQG
jgi:membrane protein implicated in regulation of membrane protease activity